VRVAALLRLPEGNARSFAIAVAFGRFVRDDGTFEAVRSGRDVAGSVIGSRQRERILSALGIKSRRWRQLVEDWESRYLAHRCSTSSVCLFVLPLRAQCPACGSGIAVDHVPSPPDARRRGPRQRRARGSGPAAEAATVLPQGGINTAAGAASTLPLPVTEGAHPESGFQQGVAVGGVADEEAQALERTLKILKARRA
jgi:hypothetical protein